MPTTTNFGWTTPADTDLVKDGAAAIRTALGGVDTSFVDLKGGTTGQVLTKASGTDLDFTFTTPATSPLTTKGDLFTFSTTSTRLPVGTDGQVLTADSAEATGLKFATPVAPSPDYQLLNSGGTNMSGSNTITISGISGINSLFIRVGGDNLVQNATVNATFKLRLNTDTGNNYYYSGLIVEAASTASKYGVTVDSSFLVGNFGATANTSYIIASIQIDGTGTAGIKPITLTSYAAGGTQTSSQSVSLLGSYNGTSAITSVSLISNGTFSGTGQVFVYGA
jgi:trimeric autotransporter adhesin